MKPTIKYIFVCLGLFFCLLPGIYCQQNKFDSLLLKLQNVKPDTTKLHLLVQLSEECELNEILTYVIPAVELADDLLLGMKHLSVKQRNMILNQKAVALNNIGVIYKNQGDIKKALDYYCKSLKIQEGLLQNTISSVQINEVKQGIATSLNNIGIIYNNMGDIPKALDYYSKSLKLYEEIDYKMGIAYSLNNIGSIYDQQKDIPKALSYFYRSLKVEEAIGDKRGISNSLNNIGGAYNDKGDITKALDYYNRSLKIQQEIGDKEGIANSLNNVGEAYFLQSLIQRPYKRQKMLATALSYSTNSLALSKELGFPEKLCNAERLLAKIDSAMGNYKGAFTHYKQYSIYRDSIANEENRKASIKNQLKYEYEKKEAVLKEQQEKERVIAEEKNRFQQIVIGSVVLGLLLVVVFAGFVFRSLRITRHQKEIIEEKQREILDSIHYAKRIQTALLPTIKYIEKKLQRS